MVVFFQAFPIFPQTPRVRIPVVVLVAGRKLSPSELSVSAQIVAVSVVEPAGSGDAFPCGGVSRLAADVLARPRSASVSGRSIDQIPGCMSGKRTRSVGNDRVLALKRRRTSPLSGTVTE